ncbi:MAG: hypothetical protein AAF228_05345 [Pseudomonadota bacterium]
MSEIPPSALPPPMSDEGEGEGEEPGGGDPPSGGDPFEGLDFDSPEFWEAFTDLIVMSTIEVIAANTATDLQTQDLLGISAKAITEDDLALFS